MTFWALKKLRIRQMKKGVFWCKGIETSHPTIISVAVTCNADGIADSSTVYGSKSGDNFNHKIEWEKLDRSITMELPFNHYPRGRVEIKKGKSTIYLTPDLNTDLILKVVYEEFDLNESSHLKSIRVKSDGSKHYQHHYYQ